MRLKALCAIAALMALPVLPASAETDRQISAPPESLFVQYSGSLYLIPIANISINAVWPGETYSATAIFQSGGLLRWFDDTNIEAGVSGYLRETGLDPWHYQHLNHASGKNRVVQINFIDGVATPDVNPPFGSTGNPPASEEELTGAQDPISGILNMMLAAPMTANGQPCSGRVPIYDGRKRYDLRLENQGMSDVSTRAYRGTALVCHAFIEPISGYDEGDRPTEEDTQTPIVMWLAEHDGIWVPVRYRASTRIGNLTISATHLRVGGEE